MMPQAAAAMSLKITMPFILRRFGYRTVLISNTMILGVLIVLFATIGAGTPAWLIVIQSFVFGFFTSLQYTSMNILVYANVTEELASSASTIASTMQQMSISFGVATASLATAFFIRDRFHTSPSEMIHGIHQAFLVLGGLTFLSSIIFRELRGDDGGGVSMHNTVPACPVTHSRNLQGHVIRIYNFVRLVQVADECADKAAQELSLEFLMVFCANRVF